jgi:DNA gyrase subunit A
MVVTMSHRGYVKRTPTSEYRAQQRGGKGVAGTDTKAEDFVERLFSASTHAYLLVFTNLGRVYWIKVHELPLGGRTARGKPLVNLIAFQPDERVTTVLPVREFTEDEFVYTVSRNGTVKKTPLDAYSRPRQGGIIGAGIADGDEIIAARLSTDDNDVLLATANGMAIRFKASDVRSMGRPSVGVRGIRLDKGDRVVGMDIVDPGAAILTVTENGYGKRTLNEEYRIQGRGGRGIILIKVNDRNGQVVGVRQVTDDNHIMIITSRGTIIRMTTGGISTLGRNTQGVRLVRMDGEDRVQAIANLEEVDDETEVSAPVEDTSEDGDGRDAPDGEPDGADDGADR